MITSSDRNLTIFPPFDSHGKDSVHGSVKNDSPFGFSFDYNNNNNSKMAGSPYIKSEPNDYNFDPNQFMQYPQGQQYSSSNGVNINPASLSNGNGGSMQQNFGQGNMSASFNMGNAGIADDELLDLDFQQGNQYDFNQGMQHVFSQQQQQMGQQGTGMFSHTPDDAPIQSPFTHGNFNYAQFRTMNDGQMTGGMPHSAGFRPQIQNVDRKVSDSRSPATPSGIGNQQMGDEFPRQGMPRHQRQQGSLGNGWDSTPSHHSWNESSPFPSPVNGPVHHQISEVLGKNTHHHHHHKVASSLPAKMEGQPTPAFQTQEAKRRRRRESHNLVERRRRDNINERIQDLGQLVPQHRLDDEKVRKHLQTNAPLSPSITNDTGMSPPNAATSLLAGPQGRRATGTGGITQGLPIEDKDKGPNKGDILNGSVAWTRDLMWYLHKKMREEEELKTLVASLGRAWPFEQNEDEKRLFSEICSVLNRHAQHGGFPDYSRAPGTGLRVPGFTNMAGDTVHEDGRVTRNGYGSGSNAQAMSPGFQSGESSGQMSSHQNPNSFWGAEFKEEDEYGMEMQ